MSHSLILAEKPSVARDIARVLGAGQRRQGYIEGRGVRITWCIGHLVELAEPASYNPEWRSWRLESLPMIPEAFTLQPRQGAIDQWRVVREQLRDPNLTEVVNACDAGREGELIFAHVYQLAACGKPVKRLWISSMTDAAIRTGFQSLKPGAQFAPLEAAARCRAESDWLVGINATRAMTTRMRTGADGALLSLGRVQTPTLALLVAREKAIEEFVPEDFWQVKVRFEAAPRTPPLPGETTWEATWTRPEPAHLKRAKKDDVAAREQRLWLDRFRKKDEAEALLARIKGVDGTVSRAHRKKKSQKPPLLYDLTTLQKEANRRFKFSAQHTLDIAQALYERHKLLTYPRTDSRHLASDQKPLLQGLVQSLQWGPYQQAAQDIQQRWPVPITKRLVDDSEVKDHHAIIPTGQDPRTRQLSREEKKIFDLVTRRFLATLMPDAVFANMFIEVVIATPAAEGGRPLRDLFVARGRSLLDPGWQVIDPPASKRKESLLPAVDKGEQALNRSQRLHTGQTRPPRRHNEGSLLSAMEHAGDDIEDAELKRAMKRNGLGTPATRASIIETLLRRGYLERTKDLIVPTAQGRALIEALPVEALGSARLTGAWEARLAGMAEGEGERGAFMEDIRRFTAELVGQISEAQPSAELARRLHGPRQYGAAVGACPRCENGEVKSVRRGWACTDCTLYIPGKVASRDVSQRMVQALLKRGETRVFKGFRSRAGKDFEAALKLDEGGQVKLHFPGPPELGSCPACEAPVRHRGSVFTCDTGRACPFVVFGEMSGRAMQPDDVKALLSDGRTPVLTGFKTRAGEEFEAALVWEAESKRVQVVWARDRWGRYKPGMAPVDPRSKTGPVAACPRCGAAVGFREGAFRCEACDFSVPGSYAGRELRPAEVGTLIGEGRTPRLHGFRQKGGAVFKAALVLGDAGRVELDYRKPADEAPAAVPDGGPPPAFGTRRDCPVCVHNASPEPGYVVAGRAAWGCSQWRSGCRLRIPFVIEERRIEDEEAQRLLGKHRATRYARGWVGPEGPRKKTWRVRLVPEQSPCWVLEPRGAKPGPSK